ncbi:hypothetical protein [Clostridium butyricum]
MLEPKDTFSTLYDHYKDTITYLKKDIDKRDKITRYLFLVLILYSLTEFKQIDSSSVFNDLCKKYLGISLNINYVLITTIILFCIFTCTIKYFQMCMNIEKQYSYIHKIESDLNHICGQNLISREGYSYLEDYPLFSAFLHRIYMFFLPLALVILMFVKSYYIFILLISSINISSGKNFTCILLEHSIIISFINLIISLSTILTTVLYLLFIYRDKEWVKNINNKFKKIFVLLHLYKED